MGFFWECVDQIWLKLASVKLTLVVFVALLLLSIPGTIVLQQNISNIDPAIQYDYEFWRFAKWTQLFTAYHSFWYVGLIALLAINLIACSVERWPQMWKAANAKAVALSRSTFLARDPKFFHSWNTSLKASEVKKILEAQIKSPWVKFEELESSANSFQISWQSGRWSRVANYLVHSSLLVVFAGAIYSGLKGFEGGANIPEGSAVDTFLLFKEGNASGLPSIPGTAPNERLMPFRIEAEYFHVDFYKDFPGRPKDFRTKLNILDRQNGSVLASKVITVNDPLSYGDFTFYQASYGSMGDFNVELRFVEKSGSYSKQAFQKTGVGKVQKLDTFGVQYVVLRALNDVQGFGPGVQIQELKNDQPSGEEFWILKNYPNFDFENRKSPWAAVLESLDEKHFSGLQIAHDPGAPIYWLGCLGMLIGTFYALFVQHKRYHLRFENGEILLSGTIHRLPLTFEKDLIKLATRLRLASKGQVNG